MHPDLLGHQLGQWRGQQQLTHPYSTSFVQANAVLTLSPGNLHLHRDTASIPRKSFTRLFRPAGQTWLAVDKSAALAPFYITLGPSEKPGMMHTYVVIRLELGMYRTKPDLSGIIAEFTY